MTSPPRLHFSHSISASRNACLEAKAETHPLQSSENQTLLFADASRMRSLIFAALALSAAASTPLAAHHPGSALQLRGGYDGGGGYGGGGYG